MKKYLRLTCTLCRRDIDKLVDVTHYTPDRCTITQGCEGRLQPIEYRSSAGIAVTPEVGVTDWQPRGTRVTQNVKVPTGEDLINLATGSLKQLVIASPRDQAYIDVSLRGKVDTPKAYRAYVFRREGAFSTISGVESGLDKKTLRFTATGDTPDMVEVYVNGVKREHNTSPEGFLFFDGKATFPLPVPPPNTIVFNTPINEAGITQIDVIVSKVEVANDFSLRFTRNKYDESRATTGAYENISYVDGMLNNDTWQRFYLYTLDLDLITSQIPLNTLLVPTQDTTSMFLLSRKPYTQLDRYSTVVMPLKNLNTDGDYIKYYAQDSVTTARATSSSLLTIFPPLRFGKFTVEKTLKVATAGVEEQVVVDGKVITGPDA